MKHGNEYKMLDIDCPAAYVVGFKPNGIVSGIIRKRMEAGSALGNELIEAMRLINFRLFAILPVVLSIHLSAQSYSITPNDTFLLDGTMEDQQTLTISLLNTSNEQLVLAWREISVNMPDYWEAAVCDNKICYAGLEDSGTMNGIGPSESSFLLLHITPHVNDGQAVVRYSVWDMDAPLKQDTLTFILNVKKLSVVSKVSSNEAVILFPNPVRDELHIMTDSTVHFKYSVFDMNGRSLIDGSSEYGRVFSTQSLAKGIYYITIVTDNFTITKRLIKA
jgi:hypothetical protein